MLFLIQRLIAVLLALGILLLCAVHVSAQEVVTLPAGGLHRIGPEALESLGAYQAAVITMQPAPDAAVLYLDGSPLSAQRVLAPAEMERILIFSSVRLPSVTLGITPFYKKNFPKPRELRIRCINPRY